MTFPVLSVRTDSQNENHHLWNNNGTWFIHYTIFPDNLTKKRIRHSLETSRIEEARVKRDLIFSLYRSKWRE